MSAQSWRLAAAALGILLALLALAVVVLVLGRDGGPRPSPSPSGIGVATSPSSSPASPSPTAPPTPPAAATAAPASPPPPSPSGSPAPSATTAPSPVATASAAASASASPTAPPPPPTAAATATAAVDPLATRREVRFRDLGVDAPDAEAPSERFITFFTDGPGPISVALSNVTAGRVRVCLSRGDRFTITEQECQNIRSGSLGRQATDTGRQAWTVSLLGATDQTSPTVSVAISFHADTATVTADRFRFQGQAIENYNGLVAEMTAGADGELNLAANWDNPDDERFPYEMLVEEIGSPAAPFRAEGTVTTATEHSAPVEAGVRYRVTFANTTEIANVEVFLVATLTWP